MINILIILIHHICVHREKCGGLGRAERDDA